jgi:phage terminase large subunit-like protein
MEKSTTEIASATSTPSRRLSADWINGLPADKKTAFLESLSKEEIGALFRHWLFWARDDQLAPDKAQDGGDWTTWLYLGGRGAGKTRAGAEWLKLEIEAGRAKRVALIAETLSDARQVMVEGPTGLLALEWRGLKLEFRPSLRKLKFGKEAVAQLFSAEDPDSLRGYQFDTAWADEVAKWPRADETWDMLQFGLRLGRAPRQVATTTPRPIPLIKRLIKDPHAAVTRVSSYANSAHLAPNYITGILARYIGTRLGRQEIDAELIDDNPHALFKRAAIEEGRVAAAPALTRIVVGVDPPVTSSAGSDECGIVVAGLAHDGVGYVLADRTVQGVAPLSWARAVVNAYHAFAADRVVAEVNQGGDLVATILRQIDPALPLRKVHASRGKAARAEPVAALYEQGRVRHVGAHPALEDQMCELVAGEAQAKSPDRLDALVWAITELMIAGPAGEPRILRL